MEELPPGARRLFGEPGAAVDDEVAALDAAAGEVAALDAAAPDPYVLARLLEDGDRTDLTWLCRRFSAGDLASWIERHGARRLSRRSLAFWAMALDRDDLLPERSPRLARRRDLWPL